MTASYAISAGARLIPVKSKQVPGYRARVPAVVWYGGTTLAAIVVVACAFMLSQSSVPAQRPVAALPPPPPRPPVIPPQHVRAGFHLGVFEPGETASYQQVTSFAAAVGREPDIVLYYSGWGEPFLTRFAETAYAHGAEPFVQIYPPPGGLAQLAAGRDEGYLRAYAAEVRSFGHPVLLSFAPEPNGPWYRWGWTRTPAKAWVAAWRHVVTAFRAAGATNVTWLLTFNVAFPGSGPVSAYWPGAAYVDWVGIDGYYVRPGDTFQSRFMPTIRAVRKLTHKPLFIGETAVGPAALPDPRHPQPLRRHQPPPADRARLVRHAPAPRHLPPRLAAGRQSGGGADRVPARGKRLRATPAWVKEPARPETITAAVTPATPPPIDAHSQMAMPSGLEHLDTHGQAASPPKPQFRTGRYARPMRVTN